jgi:HEAT repeat protein
MNKGKVIDFETRERVIQKAQAYVESEGVSPGERREALRLLIKALKYADTRLKERIVLLLSTFAREEVAWPLYQMLSDGDEDEGSRHFASLRLRSIFPCLKDPRPLVDRLLGDLKSSDTRLRRHAAIALGWKGNTRAVMSLIELLYDHAPEVHQAAVDAISNLRDERVLEQALERLEHGPVEQRTYILFNLWRLYPRKAEVVPAYVRCLDHEDPDLRFDALVLLGPITATRDHILLYRRCLGDQDPRVRALALGRLSDVGEEDLPGLKEKILDMLSDPDVKVEHAARRILKKIRMKPGMNPDANSVKLFLRKP